MVFSSTDNFRFFAKKHKKSSKSNRNVTNISYNETAIRTTPADALSANEQGRKYTMKRTFRTLGVIAALALAVALIPVTIFADVGGLPADAANASAQAQIAGAESADVTMPQAYRPGSDPAPAMPERVARDSVALTAPVAVPSWALLNLILAVLTVGAAVALSLGLLGSNDGSRRQSVLRTVALFPAVASAGTFLLTENVGRAMALTDRWTLLMVAIALVQVLIAIFLATKSDPSTTEADR